ncbi:MAG: hypothetical protein WEC75_06615 [Dehalococcoidia bacterium]
MDTSEAQLAIDADAANGAGPCDPVDAEASVTAGTSVTVALCLIGADGAPVGGGLTSVTLRMTYAGPLSAANVAGDLKTDLQANPDWNEAGLGGAVWDCNALNSAASAPRATPAPAGITCSTVSLTAQPVSGTVLLATLTLAAGAPGTATLSWDGGTSLLSGTVESFCGEDGIACEGATILVSAP